MRIAIKLFQLCFCALYSLANSLVCFSHLFYFNAAKEKGVVTEWIRKVPVVIRIIFAFINEFKFSKEKSSIAIRISMDVPRWRSIDSTYFSFIIAMYLSLPTTLLFQLIS